MNLLTILHVFTCLALSMVSIAVLLWLGYFIFKKGKELINKDKNIGFFHLENKETCSDLLFYRIKNYPEEWEIKNKNYFTHIRTNISIWISDDISGIDISLDKIVISTPNKNEQAKLYKAYENWTDDFIKRCFDWKNAEKLSS